MVMHDLADDGQAQSGAVGLTGTHEGIENVITNIGRNSRALVDHANFEGVLAGLHIHAYFAFPVGSGFAGVQNQVEEDALKLLRIEDAFDFTAGD
jgi:hypothetical protein